MNKLLLVMLFALLTGCFGPAKFDASSDVTIKESSQKIIIGLPEETARRVQEGSYVPCCWG